MKNMPPQTLRIRLVAAYVVLAVFTSAITLAQRAPQLLNSERIEAQFGNYAISVLDNGPTLRVSDLYTIDPGTGLRTTRTLALVEYPADVNPAFAAEHAAIIAGGSIGATFKATGWTVLKAHRYFGGRKSSLALGEMMHLTETATLAVHVYQLDIVRGGDRFPYAQIAELHHPDYLGVDQVRALYAPTWDATDNADISTILEVLEAKGF